MAVGLPCKLLGLVRFASRPRRPHRGNGGNAKGKPLVWGTLEVSGSFEVIMLSFLALDGCRAPLQALACYKRAP